MAKQNCWEIQKCERQVGGLKVGELGVCPAATDDSSHGLNSGKNGGRICWAIAGTLCGGKIQGTHADKQSTCLFCPIFKAVKKEEGNSFTLLKKNQAYAKVAR